MMAVSTENIYISSSMTYFYKYFLIPLFIIGFFVALIFVWIADGEPVLNEFRVLITITVLWGLAWLTILMIRLRSVEANRESLMIKTFRGQGVVDYKEVTWIYQTVLISPVLILIKYRDGQIGKPKKIMLIPGIGLNNSLSETEMIKFIRMQIIDSNPNYSIANEPSRWKPIGLILLTGLVAVLAMNIF
jgi:hypothetical protein